MKRGVQIIWQTLLSSVFVVTLNAQPAPVREIPANSANFVEAGELVYFTSGETLWRTDGTSVGTMELRTGFSQGTQWKFEQYGREFQGRFYFVNANYSELWRSDGTPSGTILLRRSSANDIRILDVTQNYLFFTASDASTGQELYRTDGSPAGTIRLKDIQAGAGSGFRGRGAAVGNQFFFAGNNGVAGTELWKTNGTAAGTVMVKDINPGSGDGFADGTNVYGFNNQFYFRGNTADTGMEPWVSDGTEAGTHILKDIDEGPTSSRNLEYEIANDGYLYFLGLNTYDEGPAELWKTAGTDATTSFIKTVGPDQSNNQYYFFRVYLGKVYFWDRTDYFSDNLWVTDGTPAGTNTFFNFITIDGGVSFFEVVNDYLLFTASVEGIPTDFYRSDGTAAGTKVFARFKAKFYGIFPRDITKVGDYAFYADHDGFTDNGTPLSAEDSYHLFQADGDTTASMRTLWGVNTIETDNITNLNGKVIFTTYYHLPNSADYRKRLWFYDPTQTPPPTPTFTLVDSRADADVRRLLDGASIRNPYHYPLNIRFTPTSNPGSVVFTLNGTVVRKETEAPYSLAGDVNGDYAEWEGADPGTYTLTATAYSQAGGQGTPGESLTITFTIECTSPDDGCIQTGYALHERWNNVPGNDVSAIPVGTKPDSRRYIDKFEAPENAGTNYGARIRGYVLPPTTGNYKFWIASNDHSELWLSTDDKVANKRRIAYVSGATNPRQWDKFPTQQSVAIHLEGGRKYYVEALHKQGAGTDHVAVGWQLPDGSFERPIAGSRLSPFIASESTGPTVKITSPVEDATYTAPADIRIEADAYDGDDGMVTRVRFYAGPEGEETLIFEDTSAPYYYIWEDVPAGNYSLYALADDADRNTTGSGAVHFTVNEGAGCAASGTILREYWSNVSGNEVSRIPVDREPTSINELTIFEGPSNIGTNYGTRIRGYICPPVTGGYNFWIASNDHSELWLSTDDNPANKRKIAWIIGSTNPRQWDKFRSQLSTTTIWLTQGQRYYIEALHKQGVGTDHIAVGWQLPDGTMERPIPGSRLSPFEMTMQPMTASSEDSALSGETARYSEIGIYPNPMKSGSADLTVSGYDGLKETVESEIQIMNMTGEVVFYETISCGGDCSDYLIKVNKQLPAGLYMVNMRTNGVKHSRRLLVT